MAEPRDLDTIAKEMYGDWRHHTEYTDREWDGGTLRPWDYDSLTDVKNALEQWAPLVTSEEAEAAYAEKERNEDGVVTEISNEVLETYDVSHIGIEETGEIVLQD